MKKTVVILAFAMLCLCSTFRFLSGDIVEEELTPLVYSYHSLEANQSAIKELENLTSNNIPDSLKNDTILMEFYNVLDIDGVYFLSDVAHSYICENPISSGCYVQVADYVFVNLERSFHLRWVTLHELSHHVWFEILTEEEQREYNETINYSCHLPITGYSVSMNDEDFAENMAAYFSEGISHEGGYLQNDKINFFNKISKKYGFPIMFEDKTILDCTLLPGITLTTDNDGNYILTID